MASQCPQPDTFRFSWSHSASSPSPSYNSVGRHSDDSDSTDGQRERNQAAATSITPRPPYACTNCKRSKVRCEFMSGPGICKRCQARHLECHPRDRKKRGPAPSQEELQHQSEARSRRIAHLLLQLDHRRRDATIRIRLSNAGLAPSNDRYYSPHINEHGPLPNIDSGNAAELAVRKYFPNVPTPTHPYGVLSPPDIVTFCGLYPEQIVELFGIFFEKVNVFFSILDPELHKPERLIWTSSFLFTVICAIASKYDPRYAGLHALAMEFAKDAAGEALNGSKSVDVCQAYLLMAVYPKPKKKWAQENSWLLMGVAIRLATELGLNQPPPAQLDEREKLNRTRTWLNCFCVDMSHATQFGKMPLLRVDDYMARMSRDWYKSSSLNLTIDIHLSAYVQMLTIMARFRTQVSQCQGSNLSKIEVLTIEYEQKLADAMMFWMARYVEHPRYTDRVCTYRSYTSQMITAYLRLVVLSVGFQHVAKAGLARNNPIVQKSVDAAESVIQLMTQCLYPTGFLRYAMEAHFLYVSFAAAFLINLLRPKFIHLLGEDRQRRIVSLVRELIGILGSENVALDGRHTPAIYSRFLSTLLAKHNSDIPSATPPTMNNANDNSGQPPPDPYMHWICWPDIHPMHAHYPAADLQTMTVRQAIDDPHQHGEPDMDLSLLYFMQTMDNQDSLMQSCPYEDASQASWVRSRIQAHMHQLPLQSSWSHMDTMQNIHCGEVRPSASG